jgi:Tfp pilus assembly protein PilF
MRTLGARGALRMQTDLGASVTNVIAAVGFYISRLVVPFPLNAFIPNIPDFGLSLGVGGAGLALGAVLFWLARKRGSPAMAFLIAWVFLTLAPSLAIAWWRISEAPVAERYLYLPSVAFCLLLGQLAVITIPSLVAPRVRKATLAGGAVALLVVGTAYGFATVRRSRIWQINLEFWQDAVAKSPDQGLPHLELGLTYGRLGKSDLAEQEFKTALAVNYDKEGRSIASAKLGFIYSERGNGGEAEQYFQKAIDYDRNYPYAHYGLGVVNLRNAASLESDGHRDEASDARRKAEQSLKRAIELNAQLTAARLQLASLLIELGRPGEAREHVDRVLQTSGSGAFYERASALKSRIEQAGAH